MVENAARLCVFDCFTSPNWSEKRKKDGIYANICENIWIIQIFIVSLHCSFLVVPEAIQTIRCFFAHKWTLIITRISIKALLLQLFVSSLRPLSQIQAAASKVSNRCLIASTILNCRLTAPTISRDSKLIWGMSNNLRTTIAYYDTLEKEYMVKSWHSQSIYLIVFGELCCN